MPTSIRSENEVAHVVSTMMIKNRHRDDDDDAPPATTGSRPPLLSMANVNTSTPTLMHTKKVHVIPLSPDPSIQSESMYYDHAIVATSDDRADNNNNNSSSSISNSNSRQNNNDANGANKYNINRLVVPDGDQLYSSRPSYLPPPKSISPSSTLSLRMRRDSVIERPSVKVASKVEDIIDEDFTEATVDSDFPSPVNEDENMESETDDDSQATPYHLQSTIPSHLYRPYKQPPLLLSPMTVASNSSIASPPTKLIEQHHGLNNNSNNTSVHDTSIDLDSLAESDTTTDSVLLGNYTKIPALVNSPTSPSIYTVS
jgi:hypothetical protein